MKNKENESLKSWSTQWGLAFSSPMPLLVMSLEQENVKSELKRVFELYFHVPL